MNKKKPLVLLLEVSLVLLCTPRVNATIVKAYNFEQLCKHADLIVAGRVTSIEYVWNNEVNLIFTHVTIEPDTIIKEFRLLKPGEPIIVTHLGGFVDSVYWQAIGTPDFKPGEDVFLFLRPDELFNKAYSVVGWFQGKHQVLDDYVRGPEKPLNEYIQEIKSVIDSNQ